MSIHPSFIHPSMHPSIQASIHPSKHPPIFLLVCYLSVYLSVTSISIYYLCLSIYLSFLSLSCISTIFISIYPSSTYLFIHLPVIWFSGNLLCFYLWPPPHPNDSCNSIHAGQQLALTWQFLFCPRFINLLLVSHAVPLTTTWN